MAGKCKEMNKIKQALRLHLDGETNRSIGRKLDLYKGTVNKYVNMAKACGIPIPELLAWVPVRRVRGEVCGNR